MTASIFVKPIRLVLLYLRSNLCSPLSKNEQGAGWHTQIPGQRLVEDTRRGYKLVFPKPVSVQETSTNPVHFAESGTVDSSAPDLLKEVSQKQWG